MVLNEWYKFCETEVNGVAFRLYKGFSSSCQFSSSNCLVAMKFEILYFPWCTGKWFVGGRWGSVLKWSFPSVTMRLYRPSAEHDVNLLDKSVSIIIIGKPPLLCWFLFLLKGKQTRDEKKDKIFFLYRKSNSRLQSVWIYIERIRSCWRMLKLVDELIGTVLSEFMAI